jgi:hypothetical protein
MYVVRKTNTLWIETIAGVRQRSRPAERQAKPERASWRIPKYAMNIVTSLVIAVAFSERRSVYVRTKRM